MESWNVLPVNVEEEKRSDNFSPPLETVSRDDEYDTSSSDHTDSIFPKGSLHAIVQNGDLEHLQNTMSSIEESPHIIECHLSPLQVAVASWHHPDLALSMVKCLIQCPYFKKDKTARKKFIRYGKEDCALLLAAKAEYSEVVILLLKSGASVAYKDEEMDGDERMDRLYGECPLKQVYSLVPEAMLKLFDEGVTIENNNNGINCDPRKDFAVNLDYRWITGDLGPGQQFQKTDLLLTALDSSNSIYNEILLHPLVQMFLSYMWNQVRYIFYGSMVFHIVWLMIYSGFIVNLYGCKCPYVFKEELNETSKLKSANESKILSRSILKNSEAQKCLIELFNLPIAILLLIMALIVGIKEIYEMNNIAKKRHYWKFENVCQLLVASSTIVVTIPAFYREAPDVKFDAFLYHTAAWSNFFSWLLILLQIGKIPQPGLYIEVLVKILRSFSMFLFTFTSLVAGFVLTFLILMPQEKLFQYIPRAVLTVLVMMSGELNYKEIFIEDEDTALTYGLTTHLFFALFLVMVTTILMNFLIGLTVNDIQGLEKNALLSRQKKRLLMINLMERFQKFLHDFWLFKQLGMGVMNTTSHNVANDFLTFTYDAYIEKVTISSKRGRIRESVHLGPSVFPKLTQNMTPELTEALKKLAIRNFRIASFKQPKFMGMKTLDINEREKLLTPVGRMTVLELQKLFYRSAQHSNHDIKN